MSKGVTRTVVLCFVGTVTSAGAFLYVFSLCVWIAETLHAMQEVLGIEDRRPRMRGPPSRGIPGKWLWVVAGFYVIHH